jgi:hypothetical protein
VADTDAQLSALVRHCQISVMNARHLAALSREMGTLLRSWTLEGVVDDAIARRLRQSEAFWRSMQQQCRCQPPGSERDLCTGHCQPDIPPQPVTRRVRRNKNALQ